MVGNGQLALNDATEWLGDFHPLAEQLGSADGLVTLGSVSSRLRLPPVRDTATLQRLLRDYQARILIPIEMPAIRAAHSHALGQELAELIELDRRLAEEPLLGFFAEPSRRIGRYQLQKLRPLRDLRILRRYLCAVESAQANGWHTLVYGLTLAIYSLPLQQGLLGYAHQTTRGLIYTAARMLRLSEHECRDLFDETCAPLPEVVSSLLRPEPAARPEPH